MSRSSLYEDDFVLWTEETARALREGRFEDIDIDNLAEEIEDMGRSEKQAFESRLIVLLAHMLKWRYQPGNRKSGWRATIREQRLRVARLLADMPSLLARFDGDIVSAAYEVARVRAYGETGIAEDVFPAQCPFSREQILDQEFLPE